MRDSKQRSIILAELVEAKDHPTADELFQRVRDQIPSVSLATIYRNLEFFVQEGLARRLDTDGRSRYDADLASHSHFRCTACGRIEDIPFPLEPGSALPNHPWLEGRSIEEIRVVVLGLCPSCLGASYPGGAS